MRYLLVVTVCAQSGLGISASCGCYNVTADYGCKNCKAAWILDWCQNTCPEYTKLQDDKATCVGFATATTISCVENAGGCSDADEAILFDPQHVCAKQDDCSKELLGFTGINHEKFAVSPILQFITALLYTVNFYPWKFNDVGMGFRKHMGDIFCVAGSFSDAGKIAVSDHENVGNTEDAYGQKALSLTAVNLWTFTTSMQFLCISASALSVTMPQQIWFEELRGCMHPGSCKSGCLECTKPTAQDDFTTCADLQLAEQFRPSIMLMDVLVVTRQHCWILRMSAKSKRTFARRLLASPTLIMTKFTSVCNMTMASLHLAMNATMPPLITASRPEKLHASSSGGKVDCRHQSWQIHRAFRTTTTVVLSKWICQCILKLVEEENKIANGWLDKHVVTVVCCGYKLLQFSDFLCFVKEILGSSLEVHFLVILLLTMLSDCFSACCVFFHEKARFLISWTGVNSWPLHTHKWPHCQIIVEDRKNGIPGKRGFVVFADTWYCMKCNELRIQSQKLKNRRNTYR